MLRGLEGWRALLLQESGSKLCPSPICPEGNRPPFGTAECLHGDHQRQSSYGTFLSWVRTQS